MATDLKTLGLEKSQRIGLLQLLNKLAKVDFWHDFHSSSMQQLLDNVSLTSTLSFADRGKRVAEIRSELSKKKIDNVDEYFMNSMDGTILYTGAAKGAAERPSERTLLTDIGVNFDTIEEALKGWNKKEVSALTGVADVAGFPVLADVTPTFNTFKRTYSVKAVPVKAYNKEVFLPSAFEVQSGVRNFVLMVDASILSITELGLKGLVELVAGSYDKEHVYNFYFIQSNENDSDPATKIIGVENDTDNVNIFFLKDEGHTSIYPVFNSEVDEGQNQNLYSLIGIQSVRTEGNTITATLSGAVKKVVEDLGEISKIDKAAQKAVDSLIEKNGITTDSLSYFLLKRAGDWCQALCLLDKTRVYSVSQQEKGKILRKIGTSTLQQLSDTYKGNLIIALLTLDRVLLAYALLLGLHVFFTTKYVNLLPKKGGRSIHWSIFFRNKDIGMTEAEQKALQVKADEIVKNTATEIATKKTNMLAMVDAIDAEKKKVIAKIQVAKEENFLEYFSGLHYYFYIEQSFITTDEITTLLTTISETVKAIGESKGKEDLIETLRNQVTNLETLQAKLKTIETMNTDLHTNLKANKYVYPDSEKYEGIMTKLKTSIGSPKNTDFRKEISYNNFIEDILKGLQMKIETCQKTKSVDASFVETLKKTSEVTLDFILGQKGKKATRKQSMMLNYLKETFQIGFPNPMRGGGVLFDSKWTLDSFKDNIRTLFFKLRSRRILAYNYYKWSQIMNFDGLSVNANPELFIGLKQSYVTERNGDYISVLDNYLVTEEESQYFLHVESKSEAKLSGLLAELEAKTINDKLSDDERTDALIHLYMFRYIVMRDRLYQCDLFYTRYLNLYQELFDEFNFFINENKGEKDFVDNLYADDKLQIELISLELQNTIRALFREVTELKNSISREELFITLKSKGGYPKTLPEFLTYIFYLLSDIRLSIFTYARRYYTPSTEVEFLKYEIANILLSFADNKEEVDKLIRDERTSEMSLETTLESELDGKTQVKVHTKEELETIEKSELDETSLANLETLKKATETEKKQEFSDTEKIVLNIMTELLENNSKLSLLATSASKMGGGRKKRRERRLTRRKKSKSSKRTSRKH
jgi:hypothetical protein